MVLDQRVVKADAVQNLVKIRKTYINSRIQFESSLWKMFGKKFILKFIMKGL